MSTNSPLSIGEIGEGLTSDEQELADLLQSLELTSYSESDNYALLQHLPFALSPPVTHVPNVHQNISPLSPPSIRTPSATESESDVDFNLMRNFVEAPIRLTTYDDNGDVEVDLMEIVVEAATQWIIGYPAEVSNNRKIK